MLKENELEEKSNVHFLQWEKDFIDARLEAASKHPERLHPLNQLFQQVGR